MSKNIELAIERFTDMNGQDPHLVTVGDATHPKEVLFAARLLEWVLKVEPQPSDALRLAAHCQHLMRWTLPRSEYPEGRVGYLKWRKDLMKKHAALASEVLQGLSIDETLIEQVRAINLKQGLNSSSDSQAMEDALCLSFLQYEFPEFSKKYEDEKVIRIVEKTWAKMSDRGHSLALTIELQGRAKDLVQRALSP